MDTGTKIGNSEQIPKAKPSHCFLLVVSPKNRYENNDAIRGLIEKMQLAFAELK
jgi:hypothetical protein